MAVLIDSSVLIEWFRRRVDPLKLLDIWIRRGDCLTCGIIRVEVLRGVIHPKQFAKIESFFDILKEIPLSSELSKKASKTAWGLDRKGIVLPLSDILIAECAKATDSWLVSIDGHFKSIPGLRLRSALPLLK